MLTFFVSPERETPPFFFLRSHQYQNPLLFDRVRARDRSRRPERPPEQPASLSRGRRTPMWRTATTKTVTGIDGCCRSDFAPCFRLHDPVGKWGLPIGC